MYGFDNAKVDAEFFGCGKELHSDERELFTAGYLRSNFLCKLGYGDRSKLYRRQPRLDFDEACQLV